MRVISFLALWLAASAGRMEGTEAVPPRRVVSLAPSVTETVVALGKIDRLIACTAHCPVVKEGRHVFPDLVQPGIERLVALRPDLVLASELTPLSVTRQMEIVGLRVVRLAVPGIAGVLEQTEEIGNLLGVPEEGRRVAEGLGKRIDAVAARVRDRPLPRTVIFYGHETAFCAGRGSFAGELLERAGGRNVAENAGSAWPGVGREQLLAWNPEVIVVAVSDDPADLDRAERVLEGWWGDPLWSRLEAVRQGRIALVTGSLLLVPGPRVGEAAEALGRVLHPDAFQEPGSPHVRFPSRVSR